MAQEYSEFHINFFSSKTSTITLVTLRGKHKKVEEENVFLRRKVNEFENNLKIGVSQLNDLTMEFDELKTSYDLGEVKLSQLKKRLKSQTKLEELAKGFILR